MSVKRIEWNQQQQQQQQQKSGFPGAGYIVQ